MNAALQLETWRRSPSRWAAAFLAALLGVAGVLAGGGTAAKANPTPGAVISSTTATLPPELTPLATGKRITYYSTSITGSSITVSGLILTPKTGKKNKTVAWAHGTTGVASQCAPSSNLSVFWPEAIAAVSALLGQGWTVAATDYPGLGTTADLHPYLVGGSEARAIIDSVKAARNLDYSLSTAYAIDGHSQGGQGALWAGQMAPSYDGSLVLKAVSAIAPVSNLDVLAPLIPGTPGQGYFPMAMEGLSAVENSVAPFNVLAPTAQSKLPVLETGCLNEILAAYQDLTADQLVTGGTVPQWVLTDLAHYGNPAQTAPSAPMLVVQGTDDEAVPYFITSDYLLPELQAYSQPVTFLPIDGADHEGAVFDSTTQVDSFIAGKFAA
jgi:pimeloyl-ACP methyl ester carboxylesterase